MFLIWLNVIVSLPSEAFGHGSFSGTSHLLERELLWPEKGVAQPQVQLGRRAGAGVEADPAVDRGPEETSHPSRQVFAFWASGSFGSQGHQGQSQGSSSISGPPLGVPPGTGCSQVKSSCSER